MPVGKCGSLTRMLVMLQMNPPKESALLLLLLFFFSLFKSPGGHAIYCRLKREGD